ncbi:SpoIIE family protein phosphatase [Streptomyces sp. NL15-2K]|uniref:SpoIIE family protein phosphatase n=1 Tax=Streptomyces sp. NL15-2K TaxID=376149 RepID=UPI000FF9C636|nr:MULTISPECIES: SpoIIE family protein phosphatase [Actinomycetes]WKX11404.1 SpoIIE family protein phosphatase [Kutzneria buriramensis]GCB47176.1 serine phosphatase rsbU [Streptomyces sp. NL15-2K]
MSLIEQSETLRLRLLAAGDHGLSMAETLNVALQQVTADLGGLGGLAHWRDPGSDRLRLVAACGLAPELAGAWANLRAEEDVAPARALRSGAFTWVAEDSLGVGASGTAAVPLPGTSGRVGVLSVLTAGPDEPDPAQRSFLGSVAVWAAGCLEERSDTPPGVFSAAREPPAIDRPGGEVPRVVAISHWEYDAAAGSVTLTQPVIDMPGESLQTLDESADLCRHLPSVEDLPTFTADIREAYDSGTAHDTEYRVHHSDGTFGWVRARGHMVPGRNGTSARMVGTLWGPAHAQAAYDPVVVALRDMDEGFLAVDEDWRITFVNEEAERLLGPSRTLLGSTLWDIPVGRTPGLEAQCRRASAERKPIGFDLHSPTGQRVRRVRLVPLQGGGLTIYFAGVTGERPGGAERSAGERSEVGVPPAGGWGRVAAGGWGRVAAGGWGGVAAGRTARMSELTAALAEAVTSSDVVKAVAQHVLPPFGADGLVVHALEGGRLRAVGSVGYTEEFLHQIGGISLTSHTAIAETLRTRTPGFVESPADYVRLYPRFVNFVAASAKSAWAFLPLIASGRAIGCCVVSFSRPRSFSEEERTLLITLSGLIAQALERARLYDVEHNRAQELQRGLLPRTLPSLPAVCAAARYMPAGKGEEVGGDWYDLIPLSGDRVAIVIGDVMGHGIAEAAVMGQLRTAVRALADLELDPDELLNHLNELVADLGDDKYATCSYAVFDPVTHTCSLSLAGHLPPVIVHPDGTVHCPELASDPPLGAAEPPFETHELHLPDESLLVFCTDGLVESATRDIDQGLAQLRQTLARAVARPPYFPTGSRHGDTRRLHDLCDFVVSALLPDREQTNDDAVLLVAHTRGTPVDSVASCSLPDDPRAAGQAREYVRSQLAVWGLDDLVMTTELLVSELVGNVIRHASGPMRVRLLRSRSLICEVYDGSLTSPRIRRAAFTDEGGRGLHLVAALSQRWGTRHLDEGKCIWTEQNLPLSP